VRALPLLPALLLLGCSAGPEHVIDVRGSDSEVNLVTRLGEVFSEHREDVAVAVTGGGSGVGIAALLDGVADLANSSRALKPQEKLLALRKGVEPVETVFATDALTVIVHEKNPVESLTVEAIGAMFRGEVASWPHGPEVVGYGRQSSSGTYGFFRKAVVQGDYALEVREMSGNAQIVEGVAADPGGIGYVAVGYLKAGAEGVRAVPIEGDDGQVVSPLDAEAVKAGRYPIARPLYQITDGPPRGPIAEFLRFELSPPGEAILVEMGFYPVVAAWEERNAHLRAGPADGEPRQGGSP
jgi:phosphate transport system substrate-binding protein